MDVIKLARNLRRLLLVFVSHNLKAPLRARSAVAVPVFALTLVSGFAVPGVQASTPAVGAMAGSAGVSGSGAATYSIPIVIPPGTKGMQPSLALVYNSQSGDGLAGYGWTVSGFSSITRCPQDFEDDGQTLPVEFASYDDYCLDGQKLVVTNGGNQGANLTTYDTQVASFSIITSYTDGSASHGPSYFTVQTKDGRTYEYGNTPTSKIYAFGAGSGNVVRVWALDKVTDSNNNYMNYTYAGNANGTNYWPIQIDYTGNPGTGGNTPDHHIILNYSVRNANGGAKAWYETGALISNTRVLSSIDVNYGSNPSPSFTYTLTYSNDPVNTRYQLSSVVECGTDGSCLPNTSINWQNAEAGWGADQATAASVSDTFIVGGQTAQLRAQSAHLVDVDGDGIKDLVYAGDPPSSGVPGDWMVAFGLPGGGFTSPYDTGIGWNSLVAYAITLDYNGDGAMDLAVPMPTGGWQVLESTGNRRTGLQGVFLTPPNSMPDLSANNSVTGKPIYEGNVWAVVFAGHKAASDLVYDDGTTVYELHNTGPGGDEAFQSKQAIYSDGSSLQRNISNDFMDAGVDFDGSTRAGGLILSTTSQGLTATWLGLTTGTGGTSFSKMDSITSANSVPIFQAIPFDSNGDGLTDILSLSSTGALQVSLSTGTGFVTLPTSYGPNSSVASDPVVADYASDGTQAAIVYTNAGWMILDSLFTPNGQGGSWTATATSLGTAPYPLTNFGTGTLRVGNIESDGFDDLVYAITSGSGSSLKYTWHYELHNGSEAHTDGTADMVTSITQGISSQTDSNGNSLGNKVSFLYDSLSNADGVYTEGSSANYPDQDVQPDMQVVYKLTNSPLSGGSYNTNYTYAGDQFDTNGRGNLGFGTRTITDGRSGNVETLSFEQTFPWTGMVLTDTLTKSQTNGGGKIRVVTNSAPDKIRKGNGLPVLPFFDSSETDDYDLLNSSVQWLRATTTTVTPSTGTGAMTSSSFDSNTGNLLNSTTTVTDETPAANPTVTTATVNTYAPTGSGYCAALPATVTVTVTQGTGSSNQEARQQSYGQDTNACRTYSATLAPNPTTATSPSVAAATPKTTGFDAYGNATEIDVTGTGFSQRTTTYSYAAGNAEFPISSTNVVNGAPITTQASWDYSIGMQTGATDPNGNPTSMLYDGFARPSQLTRADGSKTTWTYAWCNGGGAACPSGASYEVTTKQISGGTTTTTIPTGYTAYDSLGQPIEQGTTLLGGLISRVDTTYDSSGDVISVTKPYTGTAPGFVTTYVYDLAMHRLLSSNTPQNESDPCSPSCDDNTTLTYSGFSTTVEACANAATCATSTSIQTTTRTSDTQGRIISVLDANGGSTTYTYDPFGELASVTDADGNKTTLTYDGLGHRISMTEPNMGTWAYAPDALGEVDCQTDAKGQSIIMGYDTLGRVISKLETAGAGNCNATAGTSSSWTYDTLPNGQPNPHGLGLPASVSDSNGFQRAYDYDQFSRPQDVTTTLGGTPYVVSMGYDNFSRVSTVTYPASVTPAASGSTPTAAAVATPSTVVLGSGAITLDGSTSTDPNGLPLQYQWSQATAVPVSIPLGDFDSATATTTFTPTVAGNYSFQLQVIDSASAISAPVTVSVTVQPVAPTGLAANPNPSVTGNVNLSWASVVGANSYNVYQSTDNVSFTYQQNVADNGTGTETAQVPNLANGSYYFAVSAVANGVEGPRSSSLSAPVTLYPPAPPHLGAGSGSSSTGNYNVSWNTDAALPGISTITYHLMEAGGNANGPTQSYSQVWSGTGNSGSITVPISHPGNQYYYYYYYVYASDVNGPGPNSSTASIHVVVTPGVPSSINGPANPYYYANYNITWGSASGKVTNYQLYQGTSSSFTSQFKAYDGSALYDSITVTAYGTYYYRVRACNENGSVTNCSGWQSYVDVNVQSFTGCPLGQKCGLLKQAPRQPDAAPSQSSAATAQAAPTAFDADAQPNTTSLTLTGAQIQAPRDEGPKLEAVLPALAKASSIAAGARRQPTPVQPVDARLATLAQRRQQFAAQQPLQPSEKALQAKLDRLVQLAQGYTAPGPQLPGSADGRPRYAPPVYAAYAGAKLQDVSSSPYRFAVQYNYDPSSMGLQSVSDASTQFIYWRAATDSGSTPVDAFGHLEAYVDGNNVSTVTTYDGATGNLTGISTGIGASTAIQQLAYAWDGFGNLTQRCDANRGLFETFQYDALNRIKASTATSGGALGQCNTPGPTTVAAMAITKYSNSGNILTRKNSGLGITLDTYSYGGTTGGPHAVTSISGNTTASYAYDANGNMICRDMTGTSCTGSSPTPNIVWNDDNLPVSITGPNGTSTFSYGPDMQRYQQTATNNVTGVTTTTTYVGNLFQVVSTPSGTQYQHSILAAGGVVAVHTLDQAGNASTSYIHTDHLGSVDTETNDQGVVTLQMSFDAFGLRRDPNNWSYDLTPTQVATQQDPTHKGYTYQEQLDNVELVHMNGRVYDPTIGRFISADPVIQAPFNTQSFNRYTYVFNNPLRGIDPTGFDKDESNSDDDGGGDDDPESVYTDPCDASGAAMECSDGTGTAQPSAGVGMHLGAAGVNITAGAYGTANVKAANNSTSNNNDDGLDGNFLDLLAEDMVLNGNDDGADGVVNGSANGAGTPGANSVFLGTVPCIYGGADWNCGTETEALIAEAMNNFINIRELAALGYAEAGVNLPLGAPKAIDAAEWSVKNRVDDVGFPDNYYDVIHQTHGNKYDYRAVGTANWAQAFNTSTMTTQQQSEYYYALAVATWIVNSSPFEPDPTNDGTFFYSGTSPPSVFFAPGIANHTLIPTLTVGQGQYQMTYLTTP